MRILGLALSTLISLDDIKLPIPPLPPWVTTQADLGTMRTSSVAWISLKGVQGNLAKIRDFPVALTAPVNEDFAKLLMRVGADVLLSHGLQAMRAFLQLPGL